MPHLQFEVSAELPAETKREFAAWVTERYAEAMDTTTGHIAVTIREYERANLALGRVGKDEPVAVINADVRGGRSADQRRAFAERMIADLESRFSIPESNAYVVYTERPGEDFHLAEGLLESWGARRRSWSRRSGRIEPLSRRIGTRNVPFTRGACRYK